MKFSCCSLLKDDIDLLSNEQYTEEETIQVFKVLSHPLRLKILRVLLVDNEICTCEVADLFSEVQPAVTKQLSKMKREGLLSSRKISIKKNEQSGEYEKIVTSSGKWTYYRIAEDKKDLIQHLLQPFINEEKVNEKIQDKQNLVIVVS